MFVLAERSVIAELKCIADMPDEIGVNISLYITTECIHTVPGSFIRVLLCKYTTCSNSVNYVMNTTVHFLTLLSVST